MTCASACTFNLCSQLPQFDILNLGFQFNEHDRKMLLKYSYNSDQTNNCPDLQSSIYRIRDSNKSNHKTSFKLQKLHFSFLS